MSEKEAATKRAQILKELRAEHQESVDHTQALLKEQSKIERDLLKLIKDQALTVPTISEQLNLPTHRVLWFLTALKKYDKVREDGMDGEYVLYKRSEV